MWFLPPRLPCSRAKATATSVVSSSRPAANIRVLHPFQTTQRMAHPRDLLLGRQCHGKAGQTKKSAGLYVRVSYIWLDFARLAVRRRSRSGDDKSMLDVWSKAHHTILGVLVAAVAFILHPALVAAVPAAPPVITNITVVIKPGKLSGRAMATVKGKTANIAANTVQAWTIQQGQGALLLLAPLKKGQPYRLRYSELDAGTNRLLGYVPFAQAKLAESKTTGPLWAFALNGVDPLSKEPVIFAGDTEAIHARLDSASGPVFAADSLSFRSSGA